MATVSHDRAGYSLRSYKQQPRPFAYRLYLAAIACSALAGVLLMALWDPCSSIDQLTVYTEDPNCYENKPLLAQQLQYGWLARQSTCIVSFDIPGEPITADWSVGSSRVAINGTSVSIGIYSSSLVQGIRLRADPIDYGRKCILKSYFTAWLSVPIGPADEGTHVAIVGNNETITVSFQVFLNPQTIFDFERDCGPWFDGYSVLVEGTLALVASRPQIVPHPLVLKMTAYPNMTVFLSGAPVPLGFQDSSICARKICKSIPDRFFVISGFISAAISVITFAIKLPVFQEPERPKSSLDQELME